MVDQPQHTFAMTGARSAIAHGLDHIEEQVDAIERSIEENSGLVFDLSKAIIESVCRTILRDRRVPYSDNDDLARLFQMVRNNLSMLPAQESQEVAVRDSIVRTLGGLSGAIQGIAELRNQLSFASHGGDSLRPFYGADACNSSSPIGRYHRWFFCTIFMLLAGILHLKWNSHRSAI